MVFSDQSHSPSPDATSDTSSNYNAPTGLPHPKPKHNIREQLIQAGFEPRGSKFILFFFSFSNSLFLIQLARITTKINPPKEPGT